MFELCKEHNYRKDLHYHVVAGAGVWMPKNIGHPDSVNFNVIYPNRDAAHRVFIRAASDLSEGIVEPEDFSESLSAWYEIVDEVEREHALEVITYLGIEFHNGALPIALIACNGCVPYGMN